MTIATEVWKAWESKVVDGKFPLQKWIGGSDHSAVFLTARGPELQNAVVKLIPASSVNADAQLALWAEVAKLSHSHLIRIFEYGRAQIEGTAVLYVVMESADENLGEVLPVRALSSEETQEVLKYAADVLAFLHRAGFVHGALKPSNILAVGNELKLSSDGIRKPGDRGNKDVSSRYDAPEVPSTGNTQAADMWSLGMVSLAVLTQNEPKNRNAGQPSIVIPQTIAPALRKIIEQCLQTVPTQRCTSNDILAGISSSRSGSVTREAAFRESASSSTPDRSKRWIVIPVLVALLLVAVWAGSRWINHQPAASTTQPQADKTSGAENPPPAAAIPVAPAPQTGTVQGSVLHEAMPEISQSALHTITGRIKVAVQVKVDNAGAVTEAKLTSSGPSQYFSSRALAAAQQWKFTPPSVDGNPKPSEWILRFQFTHRSVQASAGEKTR
jgi:TonB family protein